MTAPRGGSNIPRWILDHLLWDTSGLARAGLLRVLWPMRKVLIALIASAGLDWMEWTMHHPPQLVIMALLHFGMTLAAVALFVQLGRWFKRPE